MAEGESEFVQTGMKKKYYIDEESMALSRSGKHLPKQRQRKQRDHDHDHKQLEAAEQVQDGDHIEEIHDEVEELQAAVLAEAKQEALQESEESSRRGDGLPASRAKDNRLTRKSVEQIGVCSIKCAAGYSFVAPDGTSQTTQTLTCNSRS